MRPEQLGALLQEQPQQVLFVGDFDLRGHQTHEGIFRALVLLESLGCHHHIGGSLTSPLSGLMAKIQPLRFVGDVDPDGLVVVFLVLPDWEGDLPKIAHEFIVDGFGLGEFQVDGPLLEEVVGVGRKVEQSWGHVDALLDARRGGHLEDPLLVAILLVIEHDECVDVLEEDDAKGLPVGVEFALVVVVAKFALGHHDVPISPGKILLGLLEERSLANDGFLRNCDGLAQDLLYLFDDDGSFGLVREAIIVG